MRVTACTFLAFIMVVFQLSVPVYAANDSQDGTEESISYGMSYYNNPSLMPFASIQPSAAVTHPIKDFTNVLWYKYSDASKKYAWPSSITYDFVIVRYNDNGVNQWYVVCFGTESTITYNSSTGHYAGSNLLFYNVQVNASGYNSFENYPPNIGVVNVGITNLQATENATKDVVWEAKILKKDFPFRLSDEPGELPPTEPPETSEPSVPPIVIPPHNPDMVPWDGNRMSDFFIYVSTAMGHIVNVGLKYFGIILAVYVMIRIIRDFENKTAGGGEG